MLYSGSSKNYLFSFRVISKNLYVNDCRHSTVLHSVANDPRAAVIFFHLEFIYLLQKPTSIIIYYRSIFSKGYKFVERKTKYENNTGFYEA